MCTYVPVCIYTYTYIYVYTYIWIYIYIHLYTYILFMYTCLYKYTYTYLSCGASSQARAAANGDGRSATYKSSCQVLLCCLVVQSCRAVLSYSLESRVTSSISSHTHDSSSLLSAVRERAVCRVLCGVWRGVCGGGCWRKEVGRQVDDVSFTQGWLLGVSQVAESLWPLPVSCILMAP